MIQMTQKPLAEVCDIQMGQSPPSSDYNESGKGLPFFQGKAEFGVHHPVASKWVSKPIRIAERNDILVSVRAPVGSVNIADQTCCIGRGLAALRFAGNYKYLYYFIQSQQGYLDSLGTGTTFKAINRDVLESLPVPTPVDDKLQDKIVQKIETLFTEIDSGTEELQKAKQKLELYKQSVLNAAIQGKLVSQDPKDEPASKLLERIRAEKEKLIKEKKLKKDKPLPPIDPSEVPFELPNGWEWVQLGTILSIESGSVWAFKSSDESGVPYVKVGDMNDPRNSDSVEYSSNYFEPSEKVLSCAVPMNSIIFPKRGGAIATNKRRYVVKKQILIDMNTMAISVPEQLHFDYIKVWFNTIDLAKISGGAGVIPQINNKDIAPLLIPLPPHKEQLRIAMCALEKLQGIEVLKLEFESKINNVAVLKQSILKSAFEGKLV